MKLLVTSLISFIAGVSLATLVGFKLISEISYDQQSLALNEKLLFSKFVDETDNKKLIALHNNLLCDKLNWVESLQASSWISGMKIDNDIVSRARQRCKGLSHFFPDIGA